MLVKIVILHELIVKAIVCVIYEDCLVSLGCCQPELQMCAIVSHILK